MHRRMAGSFCGQRIGGIQLRVRPVHVPLLVASPRLGILAKLQTWYSKYSESVLAHIELLPHLIPRIINIAANALRSSQPKYVGPIIHSSMQGRLQEALR